MFDGRKYKVVISYINNNNIYILEFTIKNNSYDGDYDDVDDYHHYNRHLFQYLCREYFTQFKCIAYYSHIL